MKKLLSSIGWVLIYIILYGVFYYILYAVFPIIREIFTFKIAPSSIQPLIHFFVFIIFWYILRSQFKKGKITKFLYLLIVILIFIIFIPIVNKKCGQEDFNGNDFTDSKKTSLMNRVLEINKECKEKMYFY